MAGLPLEERAKFIQQAWWPTLMEAIGLALEQGLPVDRVSAPVLAWAVAFILPHYLPDFGAETTLADVRRKLAGSMPTKRDLPPTNGLAEMVVSIGCEHREDWQPPVWRPLDIDAAKRTLETLIGRDNEFVETFVIKRFRASVSAASEIVTEAWARVFCDYWSKKAERRFRGKSRVSTLLCAVATFVARDQDKRDPIQLEKIARRIGSSRQDTPPNQGELADAYTACLDQLPPRQRVALDLKFRWDKQQKAIAAAMEVSESAVSQLLQKAVPRFRKCVAARGFRWRGGKKE